MYMCFKIVILSSVNGKNICTWVYTLCTSDDAGARPSHFIQYSREQMSEMLGIKSLSWGVQIESGECK